MKLVFSKPIAFLCSFCLFCSLLNSITWEIKQDGSGDFTTIQQGIEAAVDNDTVKVYPGTYQENIDFSGKNITVTSRYIEDQNEEYIRDTIIDGGQNGSCVKFVNNEDENALLCGFTIRNGSGTQMLISYEFVGGGIYCYDSTPVISSCIVTANNADIGAGLCAESNFDDGFCRPRLTNCTIKNNHAYIYGGGVQCIFNSIIEFDEVNRCNIYYNYSAEVNDIGGSSISDEPLVAFVDTFTVFEPNNFFFSANEDELIFLNNAKLEPVDADLYVAADGDDFNNSGLSPADPLQTIAYALVKIAPDSLDSDPNSIYVASGSYSPSATGEKFPFNCRSYVSIIGEDMETTLFDIEGYQYTFYANEYERDYSIKNFTITNSYDDLTEEVFHLAQPRNVSIENIKVHDFYRYWHGSTIITVWIGSTILDSTSIYLNNIEIIDNVGAGAGGLSAIRNGVIENLLVKNNTPDYGDETPGGGGIGFGGHSQFPPDTFKYSLINAEITENVNGDTDWPHASSAIVIINRTTVDIINCTIGNNETLAALGAALLITDSEIDCNIYNSIFYGDIPREILLEEPYYPDQSSTLNIYHSLVQGGEAEIYNEGGNIVNWLDGNLDADPLWQMSGEYPYALTEDSPCIDAGTLELPEGIELPEFDLAGNPRISGSTIDMGAYEFQDSLIVFDNIQSPIENIQLSNYPNPFNPETTIYFNVSNEQNEQYELNIYNLKGQKVRTLECIRQLPDTKATESLSHSVIWNGKDDNGKAVSSGVYYYQLKIDDKPVAGRKCLLLK